MHLSPAHLVALVTSFVVACFVGATVYAQLEAREIDRHAHLIVGDAAPSITSLAAARAHVRHLQLGVARTVWSEDGVKPANRAFLRALRDQLEFRIESYRRLPRQPEEQLLDAELVRWQAAFTETIDDILRLTEAGARREARRLAEGPLSGEADELEVVLNELLDLSALQADRHARGIAAQRHHATKIAYLANALTAGLALLLVAQTVASLRRNERLSRERNALAEERARELDRFSGRVAHDLKNPLGTLALRISLLRERAAQDPLVRDQLDKARGQVARMNAVIDGLLELARSGAQPRSEQHTDFDAVLGGVLEDLAPPARASGIEVEVAPHAPAEVAASPGGLACILSNLLHNAVKYLSNSPGPRRVEVLATVVEERLHVEVRDTGPGVASELFERIFEPFVRGEDEQQPGLGIGLATVKRLVQAYGGRVGVSALAGGGSCFWFELPRIVDGGPGGDPVATVSLRP